MGWFYPYECADRKSLIHYLTKTQTREDGQRICLGHCTRGNVLWAVFQLDWGRAKTVRYIVCFLMQRGRKDEPWGYKDIEESSGPMYYTCPAVYLALAPDTANESWREGVREYHMMQRAKVRARRRSV
jgi:hypothetical protein